MEAKLELARFIVARSHGEEAAREAEAHFTRVVRRHEAPEEVPEAPLPEGDPLHLPKLLADHGLAPSTSEARRLIAQGGVKVDGEARDGAGRVPGAAQRGAFSRSASAASSASSDPCLTPGRALLSFLGRLERGGGAKSLQLDNGAPSDANRQGYDPQVLEGLWRESSEAFLRRLTREARSLKTQQRAFTSRPLARAFGRAREESTSSCLRARPLSSSSKEEQACSLRLQQSQFLHGEFDPGSGRTLAARLTHASRARTRASALGKAANG